MVTKLRPLTQSDYLVTIADVEGYWTKCSGLEEKWETSEYTNGLDKRKQKLRGASMVEDVELSKPFDPKADEALLEYLQTWCDEEKDLIVSIQPVKRCGGIKQYGNKKLTLYGCKVVGIKGFEVDTDSGDVSELVVTLTVDNYEFK